MRVRPPQSRDRPSADVPRRVARMRPHAPATVGLTCLRMTPQFIDAGVLRVAYLEHGDPAGPSVVLLHGFPYDVHAYDAVAPHLAARGLRVIVPWLRGCGPTRFALSLIHISEPTRPY